MAKFVSGLSKANWYNLISLFCLSLGLFVTTYIIRQKTQLPTQAASVKDCSEVPNMVVSPSSVYTGQSQTFSITNFIGDTWISDSIPGTSCSTWNWNSATCTAITPGSYSWTHNWRNCIIDANNLNNCSPICTKQVNYSILAIPTNTPVPPPSTSTPTKTPTRTPTRTPTSTPSRTPTRTPTTIFTSTPTRTPTRTPTAVFTSTPTRTPTRTPTPSQPSTSNNPNACGGTCGSNSNCQANLFCDRTIGFCRNPLCSDSSDCTCRATPTPTRVRSTTPRATSTPRPSTIATVTPTLVALVSPTVQPTTFLVRPETCIQPCSSNDACDPALICFSGYCRNPLCITNTDCSCAANLTNPTIEPTDTPVVTMTPTPTPTSRPSIFTYFWWILLIFIIILVIYIFYRRRSYKLPPTLSEKYHPDTNTPSPIEIPDSPEGAESSETPLFDSSKHPKP